jgi:hypothetical protein
MAYDGFLTKTLGAGNAATAAGAIGGLFDHFSNKHLEDPNAPYDDSMRDIKSGFKPYTDAGAKQLEPLSDQYSRLINDSPGMLSEWMDKYSQSPYAKIQLNEINKQLSNQSATSGTLGSPYASKELAKYSQGIVSQDQTNYLNQLNNMYSKGLSGSKGLADLGFQGQATIANVEERQAEAKAAAIAASNKEKKSESSGFWGGLAGAAAHLL